MRLINPSVSAQSVHESQVTEGYKIKGLHLHPSRLQCTLGTFEKCSHHVSSKFLTPHATQMFAPATCGISFHGDALGDSVLLLALLIPVSGGVASKPFFCACSSCALMKALIECRTSLLHPSFKEIANCHLPRSSQAHITAL